MSFHPVVLLITLFNLSAFADEGLFFSRIKVPASERSCEQVAASLHERYRELSGAAPRSVECSGTSSITNDNIRYLFYNLDLSYSLPYEKTYKQVYSSYYGVPNFGRSPNNYEGLYPKLKDCLKDLTARTIEFAKYAKTPVLISTCERARSDFDISFVVRVDTLGEPQTPLNAATDLLDREPNSPFKGAVEKMILANGGQVVAHVRDHILYFSRTYILPYRHTFGSMQENECIPQLDDVRGILHNLNQKELTYLCEVRQSVFGKYERLEAAWNRYRLLNSMTVNDVYSNFEECQKDKAFVLRQKRDNGLKTTGAICRLKDPMSSNQTEEKLFLMDVFWD